MSMQQTMTDAPSVKWGRYLDQTILFLGAAVPVGIVIGNAGFEAMISLAGLAWIARAVLLRENPFSRLGAHPAVLAWLAWLICIVTSLAVNGAGSKGGWHDIAYLRFFLFVCALLDLSTRRAIGRHFVWGLAAGVFFAGVNTLMAYGLGFDLFGRSIERYTSKLKEPARFAGLCAMAAPFFLVWAMNAGFEKKQYHRIFLAAGIIALVILVQTTIRTAIIAGFSGVVFGFFCARYKKMGWIEKLMWPALLAVSIGLTVQLVEGWQLRQVYARIAIWKTSMVMWQENMLLGVGVSSYMDAYAEFVTSGRVPPYVAPTGEVFDFTKAYHAHNLFLMLLSSTGILGLVSFLWLFGYSVWSAVKTPVSWRPGLVTWPVVFLINGLAGSNIFNSWYQALFAFFTILLITGEQRQPSPGKAGGHV
jgi:O-antigen ligase